MMPRRLRNAILIAFLCNSLFILTARYRLSYDAYTHMLFATHYAENWFSLWETRWYTGFTVVSYPPLTHQLIALFIPILGYDRSFALILWIVTTLYPAGIYGFSRIFTGRSAASYAALASAILLPIYVTAYIFGQLPFLTSTLVALFGAASLDRYLREAGLHNFTLSVALLTASMAMHHATLLVQPFFILAIAVNVFFRHTNPESTEIETGNLPTTASPWLILFSRFSSFIVSVTITSILVVWPFWQWGLDQSIQTPIDHLSRHNFLADPLASAIFFFPMYGPLVVIIPFLIRRWPRRFTGLITSFVFLFLLGLGGTTSLPRIIFGDAWEWLTYDRFAFWACLMLTPFFGTLFIQLRWKWNNRLSRPSGHRLDPKPKAVTLRRNFLSALIYFSIAMTALGSWFAPLLFVTQPDPINMQPIVDFLGRGDRSQWRYLTFGFGDQFAHLNLLTPATTLDGSYHTARTLSELRESGIGQVDTSYWAPNGMKGILPILQDSGESGVRWGFVNPDTLKTTEVRWGKIHRSPFIPILEQLGWKKIARLENRVLVYENPNALVPEPSPPPETPPITAFSWGVFPLLAFVAASALGALRIWPVETERVIRHIYTFLIGLIPLTLCFWVYRTVGEFQHRRVYFTYTNALFFVTDAVTVLAIILWLTIKITHRSSSHGVASHAHSHFSFRPLFFFLSMTALFLLSTLSTLWSRDWRTSLYISLHFWLVFLLILSLRDWQDIWKVTMFGLCAALSFQIIMGFIGFSFQSTEFLNALDMNWPGILDPSMRGTSVVQLADGLRVIRAYGTLPHPNILGGFALVALLGPAALFLGNKRPNHAALILFSLGNILLLLTFSRSAWLGLFAFLAVLISKSKYFDRKRLFALVAASALTMLLTMYPLRDLVFTRVSNSGVATEQLSTFGRSWLNEQALNMLRENPITGVGVGSFILELSKYAVSGALIEPVHNILLLAGSELGIPGLILVTILFISIALNIYNAQTPRAILAGATLAGLGVVSLFDHYLWSLALGRILLGLVLGLWIGQIKDRA